MFTDRDRISLESLAGVTIRCSGRQVEFVGVERTDHLVGSHNAIGQGSTLVRAGGLRPEHLAATGVEDGNGRFFHLKCASFSDGYSAQWPQIVDDFVWR